MGYDALELRQQLAFRGTASVIPSQPTRKHPWPLDTETYKERNLVERGFSRLKDFRRIATRYDKLARNFPPPLLWLPSSRGGPDRVWSLARAGLYCTHSERVGSAIVGPGVFSD